MALRDWSQMQLDLVSLTWGILFPIGLYVLLSSIYGRNFGATGITLLLVLILWISPPLLLRRLWRRIRRA